MKNVLIFFSTQMESTSRGAMGVRGMDRKTFEVSVVRTAGVREPVHIGRHMSQVSFTLPEIPVCHSSGTEEPPPACVCVCQEPPPGPH